MSSNQEFHSLNDEQPAWLLSLATPTAGQPEPRSDLQPGLQGHVPSGFMEVEPQAGPGVAPGDTDLEGFANAILRIAHGSGDFQADAFATDGVAAQDMFAADLSGASSSDLDMTSPWTQQQKQQQQEQQQQQKQQEEAAGGDEEARRSLSSHSGPYNRTPERAETLSCSCLHDVLQVIQQLSDDYYHITTLSLDQVLHLQKRLIALCDKTLNCVTCNKLSTIYSMIVIICDRLTEMFECIHRRIKQASQALSHNGNHSGGSSTSSSDVGGDCGPGQLFCGTTGQMASSAPCNTALFLPGIQDTYSSDEQLHMVGALLKLRINSFQSLLTRVGDPAQLAGSEARRSKVDSMKTRLARAAGDINTELQRAVRLLQSIK